jgi:hypothetical protein
MQSKLLQQIFFSASCLQNVQKVIKDWLEWDQLQVSKYLYWFGSAYYLLQWLMSGFVKKQREEMNLFASLEEFPRNTRAIKYK